MNGDDNSAFIEIIPLANRPTQAGCVTEKMFEIIREQYKKKKKIMIFYNRRGSASAWICQDCGYFEKCEHCDIAFSYHTFPKKHLICHQCNQHSEIVFRCPQCSGNRFSTVGVGIEQIFDVLQKELPNMVINILNSDFVSKPSQIIPIFQKSDVILSTNLGALISDESIGAIIFPLFELNISVPEYRLEEEIYAHLLYLKKQKKPIYIQTFSPEYPLLQEFIGGNYKSFLEKIIQERKQFLYPPFVDFVIIRVHHSNKITLKNILMGLVERIEAMDLPETFFAYDTDIWEKYHGEWTQKIILKGKSVSDILENLKTTIVRSRSIFVDWQ